MANNFFDHDETERQTSPSREQCECGMPAVSGPGAPVPICLECLQRELADMRAQGMNVHLFTGAPGEVDAEHLLMRALQEHQAPDEAPDGAPLH